MSHISNSTRLAWAEIALEQFSAINSGRVSGDDLQDCITDLIADLGHLSDREEISFLNTLDLAEMHWRCERRVRRKRGEP